LKYNTELFISHLLERRLKEGKEKRSERQISYCEKASLRDIYIYARGRIESRNKTWRTFLFKSLTKASVLGMNKLAELYYSIVIELTSKK